ncbi:transmembrane amino acid transporter protein-domain-containing protein [Paraphoma chrysanthemicola]|uniref:Transmembrane amino acid transporter protein-domain-containing protein n=1 Tax=Paraphoma chrysanthemicola TaxID=798071 RepID=A0A8K0W2J1_9PLEO|nr:transmembrane amino acid transporter protein-domain-containing protein [Paraphoma chrysanthemicola]
MDDKKEIQPVSLSPQRSIQAGEVKVADDDFEVFKTTTDGVQFRLVGWIKASVIFLKIIFATGVLSIPTAMYGLGAVGGSLSVIGWGALNTYFAIVQGNFRNSHAHCHSIADMAYVVGGPIVREICGFLFIVAYVLCSGSGIVGLSVGFNALSDHAACTVWWAFLAFVLVVASASVRKFEKVGWLSWAGFFSVYIAVFIVVVGVTTRDRPAAAPPTGEYDFGYHAIAYPSFMVGMTATATIFVSSAGTSAFLPVISEMRNPRDYNKSVYLCMSIVQASYLTFSLVVYKYCGKWVTDPSLGSAGPTLKKVSYGVGLIGLMVSGCLYLHVAAKYVFVRILRNSPHLQQNSLVHWSTWLGCTIGLGSLAFVLAEAIPIFSFLIALTGSVCFAPLAIMLPGWLWLYDHAEYRRAGAGKKVVYYGHWVLIALGAFVCVGGTYAVVKSIMAAYASGLIGSAFSCADNSGTVH